MEPIHPPEEYLALARARMNFCEIIAFHAQQRGLDVTKDKVNYNYRTWVRWYEGRLATGYLMKLTGVRWLKDKRTE